MEHTGSLREGGRIGATRPVLVLQHVPWERPGLIAQALDGIPWSSRQVLDDPAPDLPSPDRLGGLVVLGGPMGALDDDAHPGLAAERSLLAACVDADVPVLGVCLGMQLLSVALGGRLHAAHATEIGFGPVDLTAAGRQEPLLGVVPRQGHPTGQGVAPGPDPTRIEVLHWHSDAVEAPAGAAVLASSPLTPVQAFRAGSAVGLQFHLEVDAPLLAEWLATPAMTAGLEEGATRRIAAEALGALPATRARAAAAFGAFASGVALRRGTDTSPGG